MTEHLTVNGKKYLPSSELATSFGYTSDYIGKLARDEKILGTLINRQWFVEPSSLEIYLQKVEIEKQLNKVELSSRRKVERTSFEKRVVKIDPGVSHPLIALAQSIAVVCCGLLLGALGFVSHDHNIGLVEVVSGSHDAVELIASAFTPLGTQSHFDVPPQSNFASSAEGALLYRDFVSVPFEPQFTVLPQLPLSVPTLFSATTSTSTIEQDAQMAFSDEVVVVVDEEGNKLIQPVFRNTSSTQKLFMLLPVNAQEN